MRRRIEASRKSIRRSVRIVLVIVLGVMGLLSVFNQQYVEPYDSSAGPAGRCSSWRCSSSAA